MKCGKCTVCCTLSVVDALDKMAWETCNLCIDNGCSIYGAHPQECKNFECAYLQGGNNINLRPDKCGVMFIKKSDKIFVGIVVPNVEVTNVAKQQVNSFNEQGYSVVLLKKGEKPFIKLAEGHNKTDVYYQYLRTLIHGNV